MPTATNGQYLHPQVEAHEERLQRVESTLQEVVATNAEQIVKLDALKEKGEAQTESILEKLDTGLKSIGSRLEETHTEVKETKTKVEEHGQRLAKIETKSHAAERASASRKKVVGWAAAGILTVLLENLGKMLWDWLSR